MLRLLFSSSSRYRDLSGHSNNSLAHFFRCGGVVLCLCMTGCLANMNTPEPKSKKVPRTVTKPAKEEVARRNHPLDKEKDQKLLQVPARSRSRTKKDENSNSPGGSKSKLRNTQGHAPRNNLRPSVQPRFAPTPPARKASAEGLLKMRKAVRPAANKRSRYHAPSQPTKTQSIIGTTKSIRHQKRRGLTPKVTTPSPAVTADMRQERNKEAAKQRITALRRLIEQEQKKMSVQAQDFSAKEAKTKTCKLICKSAKSICWAAQRICQITKKYPAYRSACTQSRHDCRGAKNACTRCQS